MTDALDAAYELVHAEEAFLTAKADYAAGRISQEKYGEAKATLHAVRTSYRLNFRVFVDDEGEWVQPETITATAQTVDLG